MLALFLPVPQCSSFAISNSKKMQDEKLSILIVDNDFEVAKKLTRLLYGIKQVGLVLHASTYSEAVNVMRHRNISFLLVEIVLPGRNGIELLRTVHEAHYNAEVIMMGKNLNNYYYELCNSLGAIYLFDKSDDLKKIPFILLHADMKS
jgi:DNA-binding NarL/FixJ family response regulator